MRPDLIAQAMDRGLSPVCATCRKYWRARQKGVPGDACLAKQCGGPIKGMAFPEYDGPITERKFSEWCFVCAEKSTYGVIVPEADRILGVCDRHVEYLHKTEEAWVKPDKAGEGIKPAVAVVKLIQTNDNSLARMIAREELQESE